MRLIGSLNDEQQAERFTAFLIVNGIPAHVDQDSDRWEIWIKDEDQVETARAELDVFNANPQDPKFAGVIEKAKSKLAAERQQRKLHQKNVVNVRDQWPAANQYRAPLTMALIVLSVVTFFLTAFGRDNFQESVVFRALSFTSVLASDVSPDVDPDSLALRCASLLKFEIWRVVTPIFIHYNVMHILFNMIMLYQLGRVIEHRYRTWSFALMVLAIAVISNIFQAVMPLSLDGSAPGYTATRMYVAHNFGGMSGVVFGLFGFIWMKSVFDRASGFFYADLFGRSFVGLADDWRFGNG